MNLLALDTSTEYLSLAVLQGEKILTRETLAGQKHSQLILPQIGELLDAAGLELKALDAIAYGEGPGSFTGLRIGCGVVQGLAFGAGLPVIGISTLLALASQAPGERAITCLDARMGEVYHAAYIKENGRWVETSPPGLYAPQAVPAMEGTGWCGIGSGWAAYHDTLMQRYRDNATIVKEAFPHARDIAHLAAEQWAVSGGRPAESAAPVYIRNKVALKMNER